MTGTQFREYVRKQTKTSAATFPDADIVLYANIAKDDLARRIADLNEDYFGAVAYAPLHAGQREYPFPPNLLSYVKRLEAALSGDGKFMRLQELDLTQWSRNTSEDVIISSFSNNEGAAYYDIFRGSIWLYTGTVPEVDNGLKLWYIAYPADIDTGTLLQDVDLSSDPDSLTAGMPRQIHESWADKVVIQWKESQPKPIPLTQKQASWYQLSEIAIKSIANPNLDRATIAEVPVHGAHGFNY